MPLTPPSPPALHIARVYRAYVSLMQFAGLPQSENGVADLGGQLFYAGELDATASQLLCAANIAGAASLAASASPDALRQAQREGVIDFLVNSLDEAVRILKNEIRKRQPVAVAVSAEPAAITQEMIERGLLPNLIPHEPHTAALAHFLAQGAKPIFDLPSQPGHKLHIWPIPVAYTNRPAEFEAILLAHLQPDDHAARRWLHLSPRYLPPAARRFRSIPTDPDTAEKLTPKYGPPLQT